MTIFPGQLATLKEGRLGSLAKLDTQNPVMYIEYPASADSSSWAPSSAAAPRDTSP